MRILHIIARWIGGGPERAILEAAKHDCNLPVQVKRKVLVLDKPISAPLFAMARRVGIELLTQTDRDCLATEFEAADVVEVTYWNHPLLLDLLRTPLPAARILMHSAIAGNTLPQILFDDLMAFADSWVLSAPPGTGTQSLPTNHVKHIPALADMSRLNTYVPKPHNGVCIAYLGSLAATKLHPGFPEIVAGVYRPGIEFDLFGDADPTTLTQLKDALHKRGVLNGVTFHGHVEDIATAFANVDIFAYPLTPGSYVTSEKALQEAMWAGIAPVLMAGTAATGWIEHGVTGFICRDIADFVQTLTLLANDNDLRKRISKAARDAARRMFDPRLNAPAMAGVYFDLTQRPKQKREPLAGAHQPAADRFLQSLGSASELFLNTINNGQIELKPAPELNLDMLLRAEGGLLHYAKTFPEDERLKNWGLLLAKVIAAKQAS